MMMMICVQSVVFHCLMRRERWIVTAFVLLRHHSRRRRPLASAFLSNRSPAGQRCFSWVLCWKQKEKNRKSFVMALLFGQDVCTDWKVVRQPFWLVLFLRFCRSRSRSGSRQRRRRHSRSRSGSRGKILDRRGEIVGLVGGFRSSSSSKCFATWSQTISSCQRWKERTCRAQTFANTFAHERTSIRSARVAQKVRTRNYREEKPNSPFFR